MTPNDGSCHGPVANVTRGKGAIDGTPEPKISDLTDSDRPRLYISRCRRFKFLFFLYLLYCDRLMTLIILGLLLWIFLRKTNLYTTARVILDTSTIRKLIWYDIHFSRTRDHVI